MGGRLVNAKDIASVSIVSTSKKNVPVNVAVQLRSGEHLVADVADLGKSIYSDISIEWMACDAQRVCEYLVKNPSSGYWTFKTAGKFLTSVNEASFDSINQSGGQVDRYLSYKIDDALPIYGYGSAYQLNFADAGSMSDLRAGLEAARLKRQRTDACVRKALAEVERDRKLTEERIIREMPKAEAERMLSLRRARLPDGFGLMLTLETQCQH